MGTPDHSGSLANTSNSVQSFETLGEFVSALEAESPNPYVSSGKIFRPQKLTAGGNGVKCTYSPDVGQGDMEIVRVFPGVLAVFHSISFERQSTIGEHIPRITPLDRFYHLWMIEDGEADLAIGPASRRFHRGSRMIGRFPMTGMTRFQPNTDQPFRFVHFVFTEDGVRTVSERMGVPVPDIFDMIDRATQPEKLTHSLNDDRATRHFTDSLRHSGVNDEVRSAWLRIKTGELFCLLSGSSTDTANGFNAGLTRGQIRKLSDARSILDEAYRNPPSLERIARDVGLNRRHLTEGFRQLFGTSIADYGKEKRLELAHRLLSETNEPITMIALDCGYAHLSSFTRAFSDRFGQTPSDLRKN